LTDTSLYIYICVKNFGMANIKPVWHIPLLCVQWKTPDDGQRNCPKHVEFYSKSKLEKLVHIVRLNIRIYHDAHNVRIILLLEISHKVLICGWNVKQAWRFQFDTE